MTSTKPTIQGDSFDFLSRIADDVADLITSIGEIADNRNIPAYLVGGFVRDLMLDRTNLDIDITLEDDAIEFASVVAEKFGVFPPRSHERFGTATIQLPHHRVDHVDFVTARSEFYEHPGALPTVTPGSLRDDLFRRDFSINAMAVCINRDRFGELVDPFSGLSDLHRRLIRVLHDRSFIDDPTRLFRAIRFTSRYDFNLESHTSTLFRQAVENDLLSTVSGQRIWNEIVRMLSENTPEKGIAHLVERGVWRNVFGDTFRDRGMSSDVVNSIRLFSEVRQIVSDLLLAEIEMPIVYFTLLMSDSTEAEIEHICTSLGLSKNERTVIEKTAELLRLVKPLNTDSAIYRFYEGYPVESLIVVLAKTDDQDVKLNIRRYLGVLKNVEPLVSARDLLELGLSSGPDLGRAMRDAFDAQLDGKLTTLAELRRFLTDRGYIP